MRSLYWGAGKRKKNYGFAAERRLDAAIHYLEENEKDNGSCFRRQKREKIFQKRMQWNNILSNKELRKIGSEKEDQSVSTRENLSFSRRFIDPNMRRSESLQ